MRSLWLAWPRLEKHFYSKRKKLLLLDFDGTLAPIVKSPSRAAVDSRARKALISLSRSPFYEVVIISGRSRRDLVRRLRFKNIRCVGAHGFEMGSEPGFLLPVAVERIKRLHPLVRLLSRDLKKIFKNFKKVVVEHKKYTTSLHYRGLSKNFLSSFRKKLADFKRRYRHYPIVWTQGKKLWEARLSAQWDKGEAAKHLLKRFPGALPVAFGDDSTDEDMFRAMKSKGITVRVGRSQNSTADYYLKSTEEVADFLESLCR